LGDIPLVGLLFRDTHNTGQKTTLYVFITPTIMRDPNFADLRLLTKGPMAESRIQSEDNLPRAEPVKMEFLDGPESKSPAPGAVVKNP
jgi:general secretion pathway protein D